MENKWKEYWKTRIKGNQNYYGKYGSNADFLISGLKLKAGDKILDIGCGTGAFLSDIRKKIKNIKCYGIDISKDAISLNKDKNISLLQADMENLPYKNNSFSAIFSLGTVEHSPNTEKILKEVYRVLKPGGRVLITVPNKISFFHITKNIKMLFGKWDLGYEKSFSPRHFRKLLENAGFIQISETKVIPHPKVNNIFNMFDNLLNKIDSKLFGFFIFQYAKK